MRQKVKMENGIEFVLDTAQLTALVIKKCKLPPKTWVPVELARAAGVLEKGKSYQFKRVDDATVFNYLVSAIEPLYYKGINTIAFAGEGWVYGYDYEVWYEG